MSYQLKYTLAWINAALGVIAGVLAATSLTPFHPSWLSTDVAATAAILSTICVGLAALLPQVSRTPANRETAYLAASVGVLPDDLAARHPEILTPPITPPEPTLPKQ